MVYWRSWLCICILLTHYVISLEYKYIYIYYTSGYDTKIYIYSYQYHCMSFIYIWRIKTFSWQTIFCSLLCLISTPHLGNWKKKTITNTMRWQFPYVLDVTRGNDFHVLDACYCATIDCSKGHPYKSTTRELCTPCLIRWLESLCRFIGCFYCITEGSQL